MSNHVSTSRNLAFGSAVASKAFQGQALNGGAGVKAWGVEQAGGLVYEAMFVEQTAKRLAELTDQMPNGDWSQHKAVLAAEGYDLSDPAIH